MKPRDTLLVIMAAIVFVSSHGVDDSFAEKRTDRSTDDASSLRNKLEHLHTVIQRILSEGQNPDRKTEGAMGERLLSPHSEFSTTSRPADEKSEEGKYKSDGRESRPKTDTSSSLPGNIRNEDIIEKGEEALDRVAEGLAGGEGSALEALAKALEAVHLNKENSVRGDNAVRLPLADSTGDELGRNKERDDDNAARVRDILFGRQQRLASVEEKLIKDLNESLAKGVTLQDLLTDLQRKAEEKTLEREVEQEWGKLEHLTDVRRKK